MKAIFATNLNDGFGNGVNLPWPRSSRDLKRFKEITTGNTVVMGKNTWLSNMPKPLPNRKNIVVSNTLADDRCIVYKSIDTLLENTISDENVFVIGGATILWQLHKYIDTVYFTQFFTEEICDVTLDTQCFLKDFELYSGEIYFDHKFEIYKRVL